MIFKKAFFYVLLSLNILAQKTTKSKYTEFYPIIDSKLNYYGYPSSIYYKANILTNISLFKPMQVLFYGYKIPESNNFGGNSPNDNIMIVQIDVSSNLSIFVLLDFQILSFSSETKDQIKFHKITYDADLNFLLENNGVDIKKIPANFPNYYPNFQNDYIDILQKKKN
jgi:hypothetical protein